MRNSVILTLVFGGLFICFAQRVDLKTALDLDWHQAEAIDKLREENRAENSAIYSKLKTLRGELLEESAKETADTAKINQIADEIGKQHSILSMNMYKNIQKTKKILTEEQFDKFIEHRKSRNNNNFTKKRGQSKQNQ